MAGVFRALGHRSTLSDVHSVMKSSIQISKKNATRKALAFRSPEESHDEGEKRKPHIKMQGQKEHLLEAMTYLWHSSHRGQSDITAIGLLASNPRSSR